jgi:hypothetical protein
MKWHLPYILVALVALLVALVEPYHLVALVVVTE